MFGRGEEGIGEFFVGGEKYFIVLVGSYGYIVLFGFYCYVVFLKGGMFREEVRKCIVRVFLWFCFVEFYDYLEL